MKTLAIDFGERRVGLAISDAEGSLALPLDTLERLNDAETIERIADLARDEEIERVVVGEPRGLDGSRGSAARRVAGFAAKLGRRVGLPVVLRDEALTSREARERLRDAGVDPRRHPGRLDAMAAQVLLEEFLADPTRGTGP
jgi:putative Holliday junction resolvase